MHGEKKTLVDIQHQHMVTIFPLLNTFFPSFRQSLSIIGVQLLPNLFHPGPVQWDFLNSGPGLQVQFNPFAYIGRKTLCQFSSAGQTLSLPGFKNRFSNALFKIRYAVSRLIMALNVRLFRAAMGFQSPEFSVFARNTLSNAVLSTGVRKTLKIIKKACSALLR